MKTPLLIGVSALTLLASATLLFAQTTTGSSLITEMKAAARTFTLTNDLNAGAAGLQSVPLVGKRTGDQLSAAEYNRLLELVSQGGGGGGGTQFGWVKPTGGTLLGGAWMQWPANSGVHGPEKLCQDAGYDLTIGYCRGVDGAGASHQGSVIANTSLGYWVMTCNYGDGAYSMSANHEILCARSGTGGGTGGGGWTDIDITSTSSFNKSCAYRFTRSIDGANGTYHGANPYYYANAVSDTELSWWFSAGTNNNQIHHISANNKAVYKIDGVAYAPAGSVTKIQENCGGGGGTAGGTTEKQIVRIARNWGWTGVSSHLQSISGSSAWEVRTAAWDERCVADGYANGGWIIDMDSTAQVGFCAR